MDHRTLDAYNQQSALFADDWHDQPTPNDMYAIVERFFHPGAATVDVGCGSGRDAAWLEAHGYPTLGIDPSLGLLQEARRRYPDLPLQQGALPDLEGVARGSFANLLCETVIMHLPPEQITPSVRTLLDLLEPQGILYLSWRVTEQTDRRDAHGRLYSAFDPSLVLAALADTCILLDEQPISASSGKIIRRLVAQR